MNNKKVCVIGLGYIGLPTASLLANRGYEVRGVDVISEVVETINKGEIHIVEPGLSTFVKSAVQSGNLKAYIQPEVSDIFIIAVPTPVRENQQPDISYVESATQAIAPFVREGNIVILESTSPIGTTERVVEILTEQNVDVSKVSIAYSPERVLPGQTMRELVEKKLKASSSAL
jgi:UDP-N-acetyl-D-mannosaminuronic acid dehydrogenase